MSIVSRTVSRRLRLFVLIFVVAISIVPFHSSSTSAATQTLAQQADQYYGAIFLRDCLVQSDVITGYSGSYTVTAQQATTPGDLMANNPSSRSETDADVGLYFGYANGNQYNGRVDCANGNAVTRALGMAGYSTSGDAGTLLLDLGYKRDPTNGYYVMDAGKTPSLANLQTKIDAVPMTDPVRYYVYDYILKNTCGYIPDNGTTTGTKANLVSVKEDPANKGTYITVDTPILLQKPTQQLEHYDHNGTTTNTTTCQELLVKLNTLSGALVIYNNNNSSSAYNTSETTGQAGGTGGVTPKDGKGKSSCGVGVGAVGWIVCPIMLFLSDVNDNLYTFISSQLEIPTTLFDTQGGTYNAWMKFRDLANIIFVITLIIVIYSQVTNAGINNYGIKKLLPKIIIGALLVNTSYFICQLGVDASNLLGGSLKAMLESFGGATLQNEIGGGSTFAKTIALILETAVAGSLLLLAISGPVVLAAALALGMAALILIAQKAIVVLLIVISPIAFAMYLLPNTEPLFKKWWNLFKAMLFMYPTISLLFGAGAVASSILRALPDPGMKVAALAATALPLFGIFPILQGALKGTGALGARINGMSQAANKGLAGKAKAKVGERYGNSALGRYQKYRNAESDKKRGLIQSGAYTGRNPLHKLRSSAYKGFNESGISGGFGDKSAAAGIAAAKKIEQEEVDNEASRLMRGIAPQNEIGVAQAAYAAALKSGDVTKARAAQKVLLGKGGAGLSKIRETVESAERSGSMNAAAASAVKSDLSSAGIKGKDAGLEKWGYDGRSLSAIDGDKKTYDALTDSELSTQTSLSRAAGAGGLGDGRAQRILDNKDLHGNLNQEKFSELGRASGGPSTTSSSPQSQAPQDIDIPHDDDYDSPLPPDPQA